MSIKRRLFGRAGLTVAAVLMAVPMLAACGAEATPTPAAVATDTPAAAVMTDTPAAMAETPTEAAVAATPTTGGGATGATLKVGLVTDVGRLNDKSFNQSSWEGVEQAKTQLGVHD